MSSELTVTTPSLLFNSTSSVLLDFRKLGQYIWTSMLSLPSLPSTHMLPLLVTVTQGIVTGIVSSGYGLSAAFVTVLFAIFQEDIGRAAAFGWMLSSSFCMQDLDLYFRGTAMLFSLSGLLAACVMPHRSCKQTGCRQSFKPSDHVMLPDGAATTMRLGNQVPAPKMLASLT